MNRMTDEAQESPRVALFVTCLADMFRPSVGFAAAKLLEQAGCKVEVPLQSCCGQPAYNGGDQRAAAAIARNVIATFEPYTFVVAPSGSCAGMIRVHYPRLLESDAVWAKRAQALAAKTHELFSFLVNVRGLRSVDTKCRASVTYHDSCSSLREMGVKDEPRTLLSSIGGLKLCELQEPQTCCGFGGLFSVKYPEVSMRMADDKIADATGTGAQMLVGGDLGCLIHLSGRMMRRGHKLAVRHAAEVMAGFADEPAIGEDDA
jgi:L-lactate dehydrogenase complex protein LldE